MNRRKSGQVTSEYFFVMAAVAAVTLLALTSFDENVKRALQDLFGRAADIVSKSAIDPGRWL